MIGIYIIIGIIVILLIAFIVIYNRPKIINVIPNGVGQSFKNWNTMLFWSGKKVPCTTEVIGQTSAKAKREPNREKACFSLQNAKCELFKKRP
ncbi:MAG: hypothetical protein A2144_12070 [Chloroflexi bacterium RBG_16_50_9]|nr:MAG: hypothetical protein A2144_12070 [Chloroflexi bacterium RBG_16_50_9]